MLEFCTLSLLRTLWTLNHCTFSAWTLLVGRQEEHPVCKKCLIGCWCGYLSGARCRLFAYGPADAAAAARAPSSFQSFNFVSLVEITDCIKHLAYRSTNVYSLFEALARIHYINWCFTLHYMSFLCMFFLWSVSVNQYGCCSVIGCSVWMSFPFCCKSSDIVYLIFFHLHWFLCQKLMSIVIFH